jgi:hypothetical protein
VIVTTGGVASRTVTVTGAAVPTCPFVSAAEAAIGIAAPGSASAGM